MAALIIPSAWITGTSIIRHIKHAIDVKKHWIYFFHPAWNIRISTLKLDHFPRDKKYFNRAKLPRMIRVSFLVTQLKTSRDPSSPSENGFMEPLYKVGPYQLQIELQYKPYKWPETSGFAWAYESTYFNSWAPGAHRCTFQEAEVFMATSGDKRPFCGLHKDVLCISWINRGHLLKSYSHRETRETWNWLITIILIPLIPEINCQNMLKIWITKKKHGKILKSHLYIYIY